MSKELLKLALETLSAWEDVAPQYWDERDEKAITALREALAKPDFWEGYEPEPDSTCNNTLRAQGKAYPRTCKKCGFGPCVGLAQQALDKKAENARELGLDYEPAQQEPVAWPIKTNNQVEGLAKQCGWDNRRYMTPADYQIWCDRMRQFVQLASPPAPRTWQGLTDEEIAKEFYKFEAAGAWYQFARAIEAKLKEKNNG